MFCYGLKAGERIGQMEKFDDHHTKGVVSYQDSVL